MTTAAIAKPRERPRPQIENADGETRSAMMRRSARLERTVIGVAFVIAYVALDRSSVYFQIWTGISAWYPA